MPSGTGILPWMILIVCITRVGRKIDDIIARIGLNPTITGDRLGRSFPGMQNRDTGMEGLQRMPAVIVIPYRVMVLIPESEMWMPGEERPGHVLRNMVGSKSTFPFGIWTARGSAPSAPAA